MGFSPRPLETAPLFFRSMFQLSVSPAAFLRVKAKTALPCFMASLRSASLALRASLIWSKAAEAGNLSCVAVSIRSHRTALHCARCSRGDSDVWRDSSDTRRRAVGINSPFLRDIVIVDLWNQQLRAGGETIGKS